MLQVILTDQQISNKSCVVFECLGNNMSSVRQSFPSLTYFLSYFIWGEFGARRKQRSFHSNFPAWISTKQYRTSAKIKVLQWLIICARTVFMNTCVPPPALLFQVDECTRAPRNHSPFQYARHGDPPGSELRTVEPDCLEWVPGEP